jgi:exopolyphosphatase/guanosine-5'-triphosphate,3'-diphosphate pyrophosphatase
MRNGSGRMLAAIDVGTNAVRLEIARALHGGILESIHQERDPIRPGEGVFAHGAMPRPVVGRLLSTLRRYAALCQRHRARVRAVATSAVREASNRLEIVERVERETGLALEVVSGREEARLICLGVLAGRGPGVRSLVLDIGGGSTEVAGGIGERPSSLHTVALGAVRLTEIFGSDGRVDRERLAVMRSYAAEAFRDQLARPPSGPRVALGSSGTINAVVAWASDSRRLGRRRLERAVDELASMSLRERREEFEARRAEIIVAGAVILEAAMRHLRLEAVVAVETGLRNGILRDLARRTEASAAADAEGRQRSALAVGRRFRFDEPHARGVAHVALQLFDQLGSLHGLPPTARGILEAAAILHDVGHAVSPSRHHRHTYYLLQNADIAGFSDHERMLVALVARYHRRSPPERGRPDLQPLTPGELRMVRRLVAILRVADALDRSHRQVVRSVRAVAAKGVVRVRARTAGAADLELWDVAREARFFKRAMGRRLLVEARPIAPARR